MLLGMYTIIALAFVSLPSCIDQLVLTVFSMYTQMMLRVQDFICYYGCQEARHNSPQFQIWYQIL